ncbi:MAG TPA: alcohol dehydrogenase catalytic domain-containing protein, partial [Candidatus Acidoferrales bacterium]|nr:alcohol dehydrogenase catalytic domain-containing protein [Candidatus Acidoferrales bacterium]
MVRVRLAGICNTDIEILRGYHNFRGTPGHEFVGEIFECAEREWIGRRVVGEINISCAALNQKKICAY